MAAKDERSADTAREADHPRHRALGHDDKTETADTETGNHRSRDDLCSRIEPGEHVERNAEKGEGAQSDLANKKPGRDTMARAANARDRLGAGDLHAAEIHDSNRGGPGKQQDRRYDVPQVRQHDECGNDVGGGEKWSELGARDQLHVTERGSFGLLARGKTGRFPAGKPR